MTIARYFTEAEAKAVAASPSDVSWVGGPRPWEARTGADVPPVIDYALSMAQFKLALDAAGLYAAAETWKNSAAAKYKIIWDSSDAVVKGSPFANQLRVATGQTAPQWAALFKNAESIDPQA